MAFENNLLILFFVLLALAALVGLGAALWKPHGQRLWRYFHFWWQQDKRAEAQAKADQQARRKASQELAQACGEEAPTDAPLADTAAKQKADCAPATSWLPRPRKADQPKAQETPKISLIQRK